MKRRQRSQPYVEKATRPEVKELGEKHSILRVSAYSLYKEWDPSTGPDNLSNKTARLMYESTANGETEYSGQ